MEAKEAGVTVEEMFDPAVEPDYEFEIKESYNIDYDKYENGKYYFSINISAVANRKFLDNGKWRIIAQIPESIAVTTVNKGHRI